MRACEGDGQAYADLIRPHLVVLNYVVARYCSGDELEDVVQETLMTLYEKLERFQPEKSFKGFLLGIAIRKCHTEIRSRKRRRAREEKAARAYSEPNPEDWAHHGELKARLQHALAKLPKKRRDALILRLDGGLEYNEIASVLGTSLGSARVLVHMAQKDLCGALKDMETNEGGSYGARKAEVGI